jgi:hypothetical protein
VPRSSIEAFICYYHQDLEIDSLFLEFREEMKFTAFGLAGLGCGVALAHDYLHQYVDTEIPLHKQEFEQDSNEELERKWGFEVCSDFLRFFWFKRIYGSVEVMVERLAHLY